ncbi:MAG: cation:proton antiporter, partial [Candidatus Omnitrophica bacterium]|nr:cation:proton antiporter [Candidatus Omnitrophota bacterium]
MFQIQDNPLLMIALIFAAGYPAGLLARKGGMPKVTGNILAGILLGPSFLNVFDHSIAKILEPLTVFAMGLITCVVGGHLSYRRLHNALYRILSVSFFETAFTVLLVSGGAYWYTGDPVVGLLIGPIAAATAPATVLAVVFEERGKGLLIKTLFAAVALDNVFAVVLFSLGRAQIRGMTGGEGGVGSGVLLAFRELLFAVLLGVILGFLLTRLVRFKKIEPFSGLLMAILLATGGAEAIGVSPLLTSLVLGIFLGNSERKSESWVTSLESLEPALMTCFFTLAGVDCDIGTIGQVGVLGGIYIIARSAGKLGGGYLGGKIGTKIARVYENIGMALLPHAGLAIGLIVILNSDPVIASNYPEVVRELTNVVLAAVVIFEIIGPPLVRRS